MEFQYLINDKSISASSHFQNDTIRVIWSYHDHDDPLDETLFNVHWHGHQTRGSKSLNLRNPIIKRYDSQNKYLDFRMPNVSITTDKLSFHILCPNNKIQSQFSFLI